MTLSGTEQQREQRHQETLSTVIRQISELQRRKEALAGIFRNLNNSRSQRQFPSWLHSLSQGFNNVFVKISVNHKSLELCSGTCDARLCNTQMLSYI